ncbi:MAG: mannose-1-phosphate guanylyltransferase/mannose-6-phosphate isomerase [Dongiaceae bacterium]
MIVPVILCGGAGTRLWPASRQDLPKPFLPLVDGVSTFAMTLARVADRSVFGAPIVVANVAHRGLGAAAMTEAGSGAAILLEPVSRDTAAAIAAAAGFAAARDPDAMLLVLAADHVIRDTAGFVATVETALPAAKAGRIVVFGVMPDYPATGYGYIRPGAAIGQGDAMSVAAFVEKPDEARAKELISEGCLWNSGMFLMRAATAIAETGRHAPEIARAASAAVAGATTDGPVTLLDADAFAQAPRLSVDYAVMERTDRAAVVAARFDWSDLGAWSAVWDAAAKDAAGNVVSGDAMLVDARNAYVSTDAQRIGIVGLDDIVVVAADGAVLVTSRARAGDVKDLVAAIEERPEKVIGDYVRHYRPWGHYQSLDQGPRHQVKRIVVEPGQRLSLQKHAHRAEHWTVVEGVAEITVGMERDTLEVKTVRPGEHVHIPKGAIHRMANPGDAQMTLIEVQSGDYLGEDDIVRLEDDYGR